MTRETFQMIEEYMLGCMDPGDTAHGTEHVRRVLYTALDIAAYEKNVNADVLICACLLHDIGRRAQAENPAVRHPAEGARMAKEFLLRHGFGESFADHVADCIRLHSTHDDRTGAIPGSIEAKILFDADKLDASGALGVARALQYGARFGEPLYSRDENGEILDGSENIGRHSFLHEYHHDLQKTVNGLHTARAAEIAASRRSIAESFYESMLTESREAERFGKIQLQNLLG